MDVLQEIDEKMQKINKIRPFEGEYLKQINNFLKVKTTYSSNAIEGNTHTPEDTREILKTGVRIKKHTLVDFHEIEGHGRAYDFMFTLINKKGLTEKEILNCHLLFAKDNEKFIYPGRYRKVDIKIKGSGRVLPKFEEISNKMLEYITWLNKERSNYHPVLFAAEANRRLGNIHPFSDGNGRVARLVMNTCLFQHRYFPVSVPVLKRSEYYHFIETDDGEGFGNYVAELELQTIKDLIMFLQIK
jgi:Fic family protein